MTNERVTLKELRDTLNKWQIGLESVAWNSLYWNNHDQPRAVSRFGNDSEQYREFSAKMLATCLHMMKGTPYIYQGEELGMTNAGFDSLSEYRDIEAVNAYRELTENGLVSGKTMMECLKTIGRDNARTPMQWSDEAHGGFTEGTPWIKVNPNYRKINARAEIKEPESVFHYYKKLIALRKEHDIIVHGTFVSLLDDSDSVYAYKRLWNGQQLTVACNFTDGEVPCEVGEDLADGKELICNYKEHKKGILMPYEARVVLGRV